MTDNEDHYVAGALVDFARELAERRSVEEVLEVLADFSTELLPVDGVGVLLLEDNDLSVATTNSPEGDAVERYEVELGEGPCSECVRSGHPVLVTDLEDARDRYPRFAPRALDAGVRAIHAITLTGRGEMVGALNIMNLEPTELSSTEIATAQMLADVAVSYIFTVRLHEGTTRLASQLQSALDSRVVIEQAKGILAERHGISLSDAFDRIRTHARSNSTSVRGVAQQVVNERLEI